jgi:hypothetical protein
MNFRNKKYKVYPRFCYENAMRPANICVICKGGRNLCGNYPCPLLSRFRVEPKVKYLKTEFFGPSPNVFIGRVGYPNVYIGPLGTVEEQPFIDTPENWFGMSYHKIIELRSLLLRSKHKENVFSKSRIVSDVQEIALSEKPTDIELLFKNKPVYRISFSDVVQPMGPSATIKKIRLAENPKVPRKIEYIVSDEIKADEASYLLYKEGQNIYKITTILSSGLLGYDERKRLVPTRWSITATDDIIAKRLINEIKEYPQVNDYIVFESEYLHNHFLILFMPGNWEFENFEAWSPGSTWAADLKKPSILEEYEPFGGRTSYAELQGGGYYASRLGVVEGLHKMRKQARVIVFREIYEGYQIPLGVWVVRETVRNAFKKPPLKFNTLQEVLKYIDSRLRLSIEEYKKQSKILKQKRLHDFS